jgi:hypothetical protein
VRWHGIEEMIAMNELKSEDASIELKCSACDGTGFPKVAQPPQPARKIGSDATLMTKDQDGWNL